MKNFRKVWLIEGLSMRNKDWVPVNLTKPLFHDQVHGVWFEHRSDAKRAMDVYRDTCCATSWKFRVVSYQPK